jgi:hypothetical protein
MKTMYCVFSVIMAVVHTQSISMQPLSGANWQRVNANIDNSIRVHANFVVDQQNRFNRINAEVTRQQLVTPQNPQVYIVPSPGNLK